MYFRAVCSFKINSIYSIPLSKILFFMENSTSLEKQDLTTLNEDLENYFRNKVIPQMFIDANLILRKFTPPALIHFQLSQEDIGHPISEVQNKTLFPNFIDNILEVMESKSGMEKDIQTTDLKWFQMNILPYVEAKSNQIKGVIITFVEITSRIEILSQYEKLNHNYENVIYALSHDLRGPVVNIQSLIDLLQHDKENTEEEASMLMESMRISVEKVIGTINDLTASIKNRTTFAEATERVNIQNILEDVKIGLSDRIAMSKTKIQTDLQVTELNFSRKNIRSILYNLISNAIKFSGLIRLPEIWVSTRNTEDYVLLTVGDNGMGIKKDKQDLIFLPRTRLNKDVEGTGTGLFIVKRMVEDMGGKVEVDSELGKGSKFRIYFLK